MTTTKKRECIYFQDGNCCKDAIQCFLETGHFTVCQDYEEKKGVNKK